MELAGFGQAAGQPALTPLFPPALGLQGQRAPGLAFRLGAGDLNSGSHLHDEHTYGAISLALPHQVLSLSLTRHSGLRKESEKGPPSVTNRAQVSERCVWETGTLQVSPAPSLELVRDGQYEAFPRAAVTHL